EILHGGELAAAAEEVGGAGIGAAGARRHGNAARLSESLAGAGEREEEPPPGERKIALDNVAVERVAEVRRRVDGVELRFVVAAPGRGGEELPAIAHREGVDGCDGDGDDRVWRGRARQGADGLGRGRYGRLDGAEEQRPLMARAALVLD